MSLHTHKKAKIKLTEIPNIGADAEFLEFSCTADRSLICTNSLEKCLVILLKLTYAYPMTQQFLS